MKKRICILITLVLFMTSSIPLSAASNEMRTSAAGLTMASEEPAEEILLNTDYEGYYTSRNGKKGLTLTFYRDGETGELFALFFFYPSQDPNWVGDYFSGAYSMKVSVEGNHYELIADQWIDIGNHFEWTEDGWSEIAADLTMINLSGDLNGYTLSGTTNYDRPFEVTASVAGEESHCVKSPFAGDWGNPKAHEALEVGEDPLFAAAAIEQNEDGTYRVMISVPVSDTQDDLVAAHVQLEEGCRNPVTFPLVCDGEKGEIKGTLELWNGLLILRLDVYSCPFFNYGSFSLCELYAFKYLGDFRLEASRMEYLLSYPVQGMEIYSIQDDELDNNNRRLFFLDGKIIGVLIDIDTYTLAGENELGYGYFLRWTGCYITPMKQMKTLYSNNFPYVSSAVSGVLAEELMTQSVKGQVVSSWIYPYDPPIDKPSEEPESNTLYLGKEYVGYYTTRHGKKGLSLIFYEDEYTNSLRAKFIFYPYSDPDWKGNYMSGSYSMKVNVTGDHYELVADEWIDYPGELEMIDLSGDLSGLTLSGVSNYGRPFTVTVHP